MELKAYGYYIQSPLTTIYIYWNINENIPTIEALLYVSSGLYFWLLT